MIGIFPITCSIVFQIICSTFITSCHAGPNTLNKKSPTGPNVSISVRKPWFINSTGFPPSPCSVAKNDSKAGPNVDSKNSAIGLSPSNNTFHASVKKLNAPVKSPLNNDCIPLKTSHIMVSISIAS